MGGGFPYPPGLEPTLAGMACIIIAALPLNTTNLVCRCGLSRAPWVLLLATWLVIQCQNYPLAPKNRWVEYQKEIEMKSYKNGVKNGTV